MRVPSIMKKMKEVIALAAPALFATMWITGTALASPAPERSPAGERILSFESDVTVFPDGSLEVRERIALRAEGRRIKRGIYRDFPTHYRDRLGNRVTAGLEVLAVERDGRREPYHTKRISNGVRIYIGDKHVYLKPGEYRYELTYRTTRQIGFFDGYDELYWNVTGTGWEFPIDAASARISLPEGASVLSHAAYTGIEGARGKDFTFNPLDGATIEFAITRPLMPQEGLTVAVSWPKGIVAEPTAGDRARFLLQDNPSTAIALAGLAVVLLYYTFVWLRVGRDPPGGSIAPLFEPPKGFSPAAARYILGMGYSDRVFAAAVVNMAVKGYLTIEEEKERFTLTRTGKGEEALSPGERRIAGKLFGDSGSVELKQVNHRRIRGAVKAMKAGLKGDFEQLHFVRNTPFLGPGAILTVLALVGVAFTAPQREDVILFTVWLSFWTLGTFGLTAAVVRSWKVLILSDLGAKGPAMVRAVILSLFAIPFLGPQIFVLWEYSRKISPAATAVLLLVIGANLLFYQLLKRPTLHGRKIMDRIEGFKMYLEAAEQDRLERLNPPERTPRLFEKYLPYALALGVENAWAEKFSGVLAKTSVEREGYRPAWYAGRSVHSFNPSTMAASLGTSLSSSIASSSRAPGSRSGSGGGGSSGGGGGGGGGGGW